MPMFIPILFPISRILTSRQAYCTNCSRKSTLRGYNRRSRSQRPYTRRGIREETQYPHRPLHLRRYPRAPTPRISTKNPRRNQWPNSQYTRPPPRPLYRRNLHRPPKQPPLRMDPPLPPSRQTRPPRKTLLLKRRRSPRPLHPPPPQSTQRPNPPRSIPLPLPSRMADLPRSRPRSSTGPGETRLRPAVPAQGRDSGK